MISTAVILSALELGCIYALVALAIGLPALKAARKGEN